MHSLYLTLAARSVVALFFLLLLPRVHAETVIPLASNGATVYSNTSGTCTLCTVSNDDNVIDGDLDNFATISVPAGALGSAFLGVTFPDDMTGRWKVGFLVEEANGLLDAQALEQLTLRTYSDGELQATASTSVLIRLSALSQQRGYVTFVTSQPFDELRISVGGALGTLTELRVFYAGAQETTERSFDPLFALAEDGATTYEGDSGLCLGCDVNNRDRVIDGDFSNFATISVPAGVSGSAHLGVRSLLEQEAGRIAGFIIRDPVGLSDAQLLSRLRITTYNNDAQQESKTGSQALVLQTFGGGGRKQVGFRTTRPFDELRITVSGLALALVEIEVYAAGSAIPSADRQQRPPAVTETITSASGLFGEPVAEAAAGVPTGEAMLTAPYPNPTRSSSSFTLTVARTQHVQVAVYDATGRRVAVLYDGVAEAGASQLLRFDGSALPSGVYVYRAEGETFRLTERMLLVR